MKFNQAVSCCSCTWPFTVPRYNISKGEMTTEKLDFILVSPDNPHSSSLPSSVDNADSLKSPNMSADSGFEGDNNRPLLLQPTLSLPKEEAICFWRKDVSDALAMGDMKKSLEDSDFNESPLEKKSVCESDPEEATNLNSETYCNGHCDRTIWLEEDDPLIQHKECKQNCANCFPSPDSEKDLVSSDVEAASGCDTLTSPEEGLPASSAEPTEGREDCPRQEDNVGLLVPSSSSQTFTGHQDPSSPKETLRGASLKYLRSQSEPSQYTTIVKPKAVKPQPIVQLGGYRSSLESLHSSHFVDAFNQRQERLSAFQERPSSSLSHNESTMHFFFSKSLETPPLPPSQELSVSRKELSLSETNGAFSANRVSSLNSLHTYADIDASTLVSKRKAKKKAVDHASSSTDSSETSPVKRHSMPWDLFWSHDSKNSPNYDPYQEPIHMTLEEVRTSLQTLDTSLTESLSDTNTHPSSSKHPRKSLGSFLWPRRVREKRTSGKKDEYKLLQRKSFPTSLRAAFNNFFGLKKESISSSINSSLAASSSGLAASSGSNFPTSHSTEELQGACSGSPKTSPFTNRALPPLPSGDPLIWADPIVIGGESWNLDLGDQSDESTKRKMDYAASIEKVKDKLGCSVAGTGAPSVVKWQRGLLLNEPDGSFVVRDSSDEHYIFSLTFKLNGMVRHVRIEHDHGNFSFGCKQKFRSNTIVEFIENAVAHSRSGRYLFFLHRRPVLGPMQVQLLHPVSRFKQVQSLQHLCRYSLT
ncbi:SOCS7 [Cordylochernes scorpioides]|uniref:SOCS7 n=1 Tax=Cordylochernes scorpioides TaxID=51811 RepID=A0ABY6K5V9_9ARAC|nr:SOCS7 [Cordylochernes scorpioides]